MKKMIHIIAILLVMMTHPALEGQFSGQKIGIFSAITDIGAPAIPGNASHNAHGQFYRLSGSGENIWFGEDSFTFLWNKTDGDFMIQARVEFMGEGSHLHRKTGIMIRAGLSPDAPHVSCVVHGDGLTALQYRSTPGADMMEVKFELAGPDVIQLEKKGDFYTMSVARAGATYVEQTIEVELAGELAAGLFVCSHNDAVSEQVQFSNVRMFGTAPDTLVQYQEYLGSLLEVMDVETGHREVLDGAEGSWQAPNWTPDGKALIYNADGLLYRFDLETGRSEVLNTGFAIRNNNDHVISFDGTQLAISHHAAEDDGQSVVYTLPLVGGTPKRITPKSPSYLHGWSPDHQYLVYTGGRDGAYDIYRIPVTGGEEVQLTDLPTLDDGPEYSPDGKYIYFNSARTGTMQIWRMDPDGGNQTQLTSDRYNNWFPHVSPDNQWIAFISFPPDVPAGDHPFYKRVTLRLMSVEEMKPRVIAYVYGGQGTMNVPSWSPDSKKIAFVSNGIFK